MQNAKCKILLFLLLLVGFGIIVRSAAAVIAPEMQGEVEAVAVEEKVEYDLPYPGIPPDHLLYRLKMLRDRIWGFLIRDPLKKSQWSLLMADKRIWAAQLLAQKGKYDLAVTTAGKAEKYLEKAVDLAYQAMEMGKGDRDFFNKLAKASLKHEEVLQAISLEIPEELKAGFKIVLEYPKVANQKVLMLLTKE